MWHLPLYMTFDTGWLSKSERCPRDVPALCTDFLGCVTSAEFLPGSGSEDYAVFAVPVYELHTGDGMDRKRKHWNIGLKYTAGGVVAGGGSRDYDCVQ